MTVRSPAGGDVDQDRLARECRDLPIFPLGGAVLMPGAVLPLHVFEDRYRKMLADVVAGTGLMGVATVLEPSDDGSPDPVHPVVGVGMVVAHQRMPDGRSNILLQHVGTLTIDEELPADGRPYRKVQGHLVEPAGTQGSVDATSLRMMLLQLGGASPDAAEEAAKVADLKGQAFLDGLARRVLPSVEQRLAYLGASSWGVRGAVLEESLASYLVALMPAADEA